MHGFSKPGGALWAGAHFIGRSGPHRRVTEGGLVADQVETVDGLNLEGGTSGESVGGGAYYSHDAGYG